MRVVITGGLGFLGIQLARALLDRGSLSGAEIERLVLLDRPAPSPAALDDGRVEVVTGDVADPATLARLVGGGGSGFPLPPIPRRPRGSGLAPPLGRQPPPRRAPPQPVP